MLQRVKQVVSALTARITAADRSFVSQYLNQQEEQFFWAMNLPDQYHALQVAYTVECLANGRQDVDHQLLTRCALLHDIGKQQGDVSTADKIVTVLAHRLAPRWARRWGKLGRGGKIANLQHAFYIYFHHANRSAAMLKTLGLEAEAAIVARHHEAPEDTDPPELRLLRQADDLH